MLMRHLRTSIGGSRIGGVHCRNFQGKRSTLFEDMIEGNRDQEHLETFYEYNVFKKAKENRPKLI